MQPPTLTAHARNEPMNLTHQWRTSSHTAQNEACVETAATPDAVLVRDTKYAYRDGETSPILAFNRTAFRALLGQVRAGQLDL